MESTQTLTNTFTATNGLKVFYRNWNAVTPKALVIIAHGFNSHSGYYQWTAEQLIAQQYEVYAIDFPGRGQSDGERFYIEDYHTFAGELDKLIDIAKAAQPGLPVFLLGHSAGGVLSVIYALEHQDKLSGLISESFAFQVPAPDFAIAALKGLSHIFPHAHVLKLKNEDFSRNKEVVDFMNNDPLIAHESQPTKTMQQLALADEQIKAEAADIKLPVLILHGTEDKATKPSGSQYFYDNVSSTDKTLKFYEGHYHDLLNDLDKEIVIKDILDWLDKHSS